MKRIFSIALMLFCTMMMMAQIDVDNNIAINDQKDPNTFVLIISNENYKYEQPVPYALNDGRIFKLYCERTLGIPTKNIRYSSDATLNDMRMQLMWLEDVMNAYQGEARAIVYYSGHGMPSEDAKHAYLLPVDGNSRLAASGLSTELLYNQLGKLPSRGTIVLLDACFSGARRDGKMLASNRGVAIKVKDELVTGNMVVFSAAQGDETAYPYEEMKHGLFTYFLLSTIKEKGGAISLGDLSDQVTKMVTRTSIVENDKRQTPTIHPSSASPNWRNWMLAAKSAKPNGARSIPEKSVNSSEKKVSNTPTITNDPAVDNESHIAKEAPQKVEKNKDSNKIAELEAVKLTFETDRIFSPGSAKLSDEGKTSISQLSEVIKANPDLCVTICGYTDNSLWRSSSEEQSELKNKELSEKRAKAVSSYLISQGISSSRIKSVEGYGSDNPIASNSTAEGKAQNRRIEVYLTLDPNYIDISPNSNDATSQTVFDLLGAEFSPINDSQKTQLSITHGLQVTKVNKGKMKDVGVPKGFFILRANDKSIYTIDDLRSIIINASKSNDPILYIQGIFPTGKRGNFAIRF